MKKSDIKRHLRDYSIMASRKTTINHAFASALSISDEYNERILNSALKLLAQDPDKDLFCVYCEEKAETWDHLIAVVKDGNFSGFGHQIGNLVPCCKQCNSKKGNKDWKSFASSMREKRIINPDLVATLEQYSAKYKANYNDAVNEFIKEELADYEEIKMQVLALLQQADAKAQLIRTKVREKINQ